MWNVENIKLEVCNNIFPNDNQIDRVILLLFLAKRKFI